MGRIVTHAVFGFIVRLGSYVSLSTFLLARLGSCFLGGSGESIWYSYLDVSEGGNWLFVSGNGILRRSMFVDSAGMVGNGEFQVGGELSGGELRKFGIVEVGDNISTWITLSLLLQ